jgi:hypothetical protein
VIVRRPRMKIQWLRSPLSYHSLSLRVKIPDPRDLGVEVINPRRIKLYLNRLIWRIHNDLVEYRRRPEYQKDLKLEPHECIINQRSTLLYQINYSQKKRRFGKILYTD